MAGESVGDKVGRVRAPRVHITYQVETGGAMVMKELPERTGPRRNGWHGDDLS